MTGYLPAPEPQSITLLRQQRVAPRHLTESVGNYSPNRQSTARTSQTPEISEGLLLTTFIPFGNDMWKWM